MKNITVKNSDHVGNTATMEAKNGDNVGKKRLLLRQKMATKKAQQ